MPDEDDGTSGPGPLMLPTGVNRADQSPTSWEGDSGVDDRDHPDNFNGADLQQLTEYPDDADYYYAILGLSSNPAPTNADVQSAFRTLSLALHPDKHGAFQHQAREQFAKIETAYKTLIDPQKRVVYDLLGEEGVRRQWQRDGVMGEYGESQKQVGVRSMNADEFRVWFLATMSKRERNILEDMVENRTKLTIGLRAISIFPAERERRSYSIKFPQIAWSSYSVKSSFKLPIPFLNQVGFSGPAGNDLTYSGADSTSSETTFGLVDVKPLTLTATIGGPLERVQQTVVIKNPETGEEESRPYVMPPSISTRSISLGAWTSFSFPSQIHFKPGHVRSLSRFFSGSEIEVGAALLPRPIFRTCISRSFTPIEGTRSVHANLQAVYHDNPLRIPPVVDVKVSRRLGAWQVGSFSWSTGTIFWPPTLSQVLAPFLSVGLGSGAIVNMVGYGWCNLTLTSYASYEKEVEADHGTGENQRTSPQSTRLPRTPAGSSWSLQLTASPGGSALNVNYGRNIFRGHIEPPTRSAWSQEGRHKNEAVLTSEPEAIRLEMQSTLGIDGSLTWTVKGTRKLGAFSQVDVGVGVQGTRGLVLSIGWSRLGQSINLPILICPFSLVNGDVIAASIAIPWTIYAALNYCIMEPRARRRWKEARDRRKMELQKQAEAHKAESKQVIALMTPHVKRRQVGEAERGGLVILEAKYGSHQRSRIFHGAANRRQGFAHFIDVTIPMAALVHQSQLILPPGVNRSRIIGFHDPAPLEPKWLQIRYLFGGEEHLVEVGEAETLRCPREAHRVR